MRSYTPPPPPRRLERSTTDRVVAGVCGGVASYLNVDATLVRVITALLTVLTGGTPILLYLIALFLVPEDRRVGPPPGGPRSGFPAPTRPSPRTWPQPPTGGADPVWGREGAPWEQRGQAPGAAAPTPPPAPFSPPAPAEPEAPVASSDPADPTDPADRR